MTAHQGGKSRVVTAADVCLQQLAVGQPRRFVQKRQPAKVAEDFTHLAGRHGVSFRKRTVVLYPNYYPLKPV